MHTSVSIDSIRDMTDIKKTIELLTAHAGERYKTAIMSDDDTLLAEYRGFVDAALLVGADPMDISRQEDKVIAEGKTVIINDNGIEEEGELSEEDRIEFEKLQEVIAANPFRTDEMGGTPTQ